jgi:putative Mn2+ efflux pump MntP
LPKRVGLVGLLVQGVATSIDALSVGFTISNHTTVQAVVCASIIALVTAILCFGGVYIGKKFGTRFAGKSSIFGGAILIGIGLEIFITSFF